MALLNFRPFSIQEILSSNNQEEMYLNWYRLTVGHFWFEVGEHYLLEYNRKLDRKNLDPPAYLSYTDYDLAQVYQELDDVLSYAVSPIPSDLYKRIATLEQMSALHASQKAWIQNIPQEEELEKTAWNTYMLASFLGHRKLYLGYLSGAPDIWFFRVEDEMIIRWNSSQKLESGENLWESTQGEYRMAVRGFIEEMIDFFDRFQQQMDQQVQQVCAMWPLPKVRLDIEVLREEHFKHRLPQFEQIKQKIRNQESKPENWDAIRKAIKVIDINTY